MRYRFGAFVVDSDSYVISQDGRALSARPKLFDVLLYLIEHRERVVSKQELLTALWEEARVDEFAVPWTVSHLRRLLGQGKGARSPIRTVHARGYQFVAEIEAEAPSTAQASPREAAPRSAPASNTPLIGRERVLQRLEACLAQTEAGRGGCCVLVGEAGIGKTRCLDEIGERAAARGFAVWSGRSIEATFGPVFGPWIQVLRALAEAEPTLAERIGPLVGRARAIHEPSRTTARSEPGGDEVTLESDRFWYYDAIVRLLQDAARTRPTLLLFDDLHWADAATWELLGFMLPELRHGRVAIMAAKREGARVEGREAGLPHNRDAERLELAALAVSEVEEYIRVRTGVAAPNRALCEAVQAVSLGNPWYLRETVELLFARHGQSETAFLEPSAVEPPADALAILRGRMAPLSADARGSLATAAVLGERFAIELLARVAGLEMPRVLAALDAAQQLGIVVLELPQHARFRHGLLRSLLYDELSTAERLRLHRATAHALEETLDPLHFGAIAHHYHCSLALGDYPRAVAAALRAAEQAERALAFVDAAQFLQWAIAARANDPSLSRRARAELWLRRAELERLAGRQSEARASATQVIELAQPHAAHDLVVAAARVLRSTYALGAMPDPLALSALEEVRRSAPSTELEVRVGALSLLSFLPPYALDIAQSKALSAEAIALAEPLASPSALREALHARLYALSGPDDIDALLRAAEALLAVGGERPPWAAVEAHLASYRAHLYRCDLEAADASLAALGREGRERGLTDVGWFYDFFCAQRSFSRGQLAESEAAFAELAQRGAQLSIPQAPILCAVAKSLLAHDREGMAAVGEVQNHEVMIAGLLAMPAPYAATGARLAAELGRLEPARQILFQLSQRDFAGVVKDLGYVNALANLSIVAIALGDGERARVLYERLSPYPAHNTPNGVVGFYEGAAARFLAGLAAFLDEPGQAARYFDMALELNQQLGAKQQVARTYFEYARFSRARGDARKAEQLTQRAHSLAVELGMRQLAEAARTL